MRQIQLGKTTVSETAYPYIIAEIGVNHEGSLDKALELIDLARQGGAQAAKFQTYKAATLAAKESPAYWDTTKETTQSQFELFKKYDSFGQSEYRRLAEHCARVGIDFLSTPFDEEAVQFLNPLVPFFKIASADITNVPLLRAVASTGKPVVLSVGASRLGEIDFALMELRSHGTPCVALLHCILNYPTSHENANLEHICHLRSTYPDLVIGYSDHTVPDPHMNSLVAALCRGALILEKHFTFNKALPGNDHYHAMTAEDLGIFVEQIPRLLKLKGSPLKAPLSTEEVSRRNARRSLVSRRAIKKGEKLNSENTISKRPATGISPLYYDKVMGLPVLKDLEDDHILQWTDIDASQIEEKVVGIIQARMDSSRFPGKMMADLGGKPLIEWIFSRVLRSLELDEIILATSKSKTNDILESFARSRNIRVIRGDESDVLGRFQQAAELSRADIIVRICGDNPFIDPKELDRLVVDYQAHRPDYAFNHLSRMGSRYADGFGAEIFSKNVLDEMAKHALEPLQREHVTRYIWDQAHAFTIRAIPAPQELAFESLRFDIDSKEDLARLQSIAAIVGIEGAAHQFIAASARS